jgi:hypothetical protein
MASEYITLQFPLKIDISPNRRVHLTLLKTSGCFTNNQI